MRRNIGPAAAQLAVGVLTGGAKLSL